MGQKAVELILMRQLASCLAVPVFLVDPEGTLLYYNEPAERLLGSRYDETGEMPASEWSTVFTPTAEDGSTLPPEELALSAALRKWHPAHRGLIIRGLDGVTRRIAVTAFPLEGQGGRRLGAVAIFWEERPS
jgi:PAS domain-containing protein